LVRTNDISTWTLIDVANAIKRREVSACEATEACLHRVEKWQPVINCFISVNPERALRIAQERDDELSRNLVRGPLHGVPLAHKDLFLRKDEITTAGSEILRHQKALMTATVIERLEAAGSITIGSLNMSEFAIGPTGHNEHFGDCRNPWNPDHISGGSSSGSGAAVAARLIFGSIGSDTGGSIRGPAANCGIVGIKPTYGRVSRYGVIPRSWTMDCVGPLARTVPDCACLLSVIAGFDSRDSTSSRKLVPNYLQLVDRGIEGVRIAIPDDSYYNGVADEVRSAIESAIVVLRDLSSEIVRVNIPNVSPLYALGDTILKCEGPVVHQKWLHKRSKDYSVHARTRLDAGLYIPASLYIKALNLRKTMLREFLSSVFNDAEVLVSPCIGFPSPRLLDSHDEHSKEVASTVSNLTKYTRPFSYLGLPSISVPCGRSQTGLPIAFQLIGSPFTESLLFQVGNAYQQATYWHLPAPALTEKEGARQVNS